MEFVLGLIAWSILGGVIFLIIMACMYGCSDGYAEIVMGNLNPIWQYRTRRVNWLGAMLISVFFNLLCPMLSLVYWLYKICTVGKGKQI